MKKLFRKIAAMLLIMCMCFSLCMSANLTAAFAQDAGSDNVRETDVSQARDGCVLVKINGRFSYISKEEILKRINEIRLEACNEGIGGLTSDDYVPIRWSSDLEWIAQTRASEAVLLRDHTRPNGSTCFTASHNGVKSNGEVLAWNYSWDSQSDKRMADIMQGIEQWYEEKEDLVNNTGRETGHYEIMIDPANRSVGIGGFVTDGIDMGCVAGEFSANLLQPEEQTGASGEYDQVVEIKADTLSSDDAADTTVITVGKPMNLNARFISTYLDESCMYDPKNISCDVTPLDLVWKSEDTSIATVDSDGVVNGITPGNTTITASYKSFTYSTFVQVKKYDPRDYNTDTDVGDLDGEYSFTGDGDWYGWSSYVDYNPDKGRTISGRSYKVTLPQDGRIKIEITADAGVFMDAQITSGDGYYQDWEMGQSDESLNFCETSDVLQKGTYYVSMGYDLTTRDEYILYGYPGKNYFYHKLTFVALSDEEAAQIRIDKMKEKAGKIVERIGSIPDVSALTLDDEDLVNAAVEALDALSDEEKSYIPEAVADKLNAAVEKIRELKETPDNPGDPSDPTPGEPVGPDDPVPADPCEKGHSFGAWETTKAATELAAGVQSRTCTVCGFEETGTLAKLAPSLPAVTILKPVSLKKAATVKWKKLSVKNRKKVGSIQIQYSTDKTFRKGVKSVYVKKSLASKKIKKLKSKKKYYFRIRAYKKSGGVTHISKWSKVRYVKVK